MALIIIKPPKLAVTIITDLSVDSEIRLTRGLGTLAPNLSQRRGLILTLTLTSHKEEA